MMSSRLRKTLSLSRENAHASKTERNSTSLICAFSSRRLRFSYGFSSGFCGSGCKIFSTASSFAFVVVGSSAFGGGGVGGGGGAGVLGAAGAGALFAVLGMF